MEAVAAPPPKHLLLFGWWCSTVTKSNGGYGLPSMGTVNNSNKTRHVLVYSVSNFVLLLK